jgi:hypothetical protein
VDDVIQILTISRFSEDVYALSLYDSRASIKLKEDPTSFWDLGELNFFLMYKIYIAIHKASFSILYNY